MRWGRGKGGYGEKGGDRGRGRQETRRWEREEKIKEELGGGKRIKGKEGGRETMSHERGEERETRDRETP